MNLHIFSVSSAFLAAAVAIALAKPEERGRASAIVFTGFTVLTALGLPLGSYIGSISGDVWLPFWDCLGVPWFGGNCPIISKTPPVNLSSFGQVFRDGLLLIVLSVTIFQFAGQMAVFAFIAPWLQTFTSLSATGISLILLIAGVGGIFGNYVSGLSADRYGARATQLVLVIVLAVTMMMLSIVSLKRVCDRCDSSIRVGSGRSGLYLASTGSGSRRQSCPFQCDVEPKRIVYQCWHRSWCHGGRSIR